MISKKRKGFSLAEVLITLAVIGVVASMSIPTLIANKNKSEYVAGLKKAYASVSQALQKITEEMGCNNDLACTGLFFNTPDIGQALAARMNVTKNCGNTTLGSSGDTGCWAPFSHLDQRSSNIIDPDTMGAYYKFQTADGMSFLVQRFSGDCSSDFSLSNTGPAFNTCGTLFVDVNGKKGPNLRGRDVFTFYIAKGTQLVPVGSHDEGFYIVTWKTGYCGQGFDPGEGSTCAGRVMEEGWQMNY